MKFEIITIFPDFFRGPLDYGIVRRARESGLVEITIHDLRAFAHDRHRTVDDRPFGGGEGMVLKPEPIFECLEALGVGPREQRVHGSETRATRASSTRASSTQAWVGEHGSESHATHESVVLLSAQGRMFDQALAAELAQLDRIVLLCGRYEGVDERVSECLADREISVGDYVVSGGELPAAIIVDAVTRLLPGALGNEASARQESFGAGVGSTALVLDSEGKKIADSTFSPGGLLDYPHYTRPAEFRGMKVPELLMAGNHEEIRRWRRRKALEKTLRNRPDLLEQVELSEEDREMLRALGFRL
jgi:tRNA (guanine37-N1)-methyltransferase